MEEYKSGSGGGGDLKKFKVGKVFAKYHILEMLLYLEKEHIFEILH